MTLKEALDSTARGYLFRLLSETRSNANKAAKIAGVQKPAFYRILRRYGIIIGRMRKATLPEAGFRSFHEGPPHRE